MALALCITASANAQSAGGETAASETWAKAAAVATPSVPVAIRLSGLSASGEPANLADAEPSTGEDALAAPAIAEPSARALTEPNAEFIKVAGESGASNLVASPTGADVQAAGTAEIPPASSNHAAAQASPSASSAAQNRSDQQTQQDDTASYQEDPDGMPPPRQYMPTQSAGDDTVFPTPFGIDLAEARRTLKSGEELDGLLIVNVHKGSAAANAGLQGYSHGMHDAITGAAMAGAIAGAMFIPMAALAVPVIQAIPFGESYDLIIGVDGSRVTNYLDFTHRTRDVLPGELVYLSVVRDGKRIQVTLTVPADLTARGD